MDVLRTGNNSDKNGNRKGKRHPVRERQADRIGDKNQRPRGKGKGTHKLDGRMERYYKRQGI